MNLLKLICLLLVSSPAFTQDIEVIALIRPWKEMNKSIKKSLKILEKAKDTTFQDEIDDFLANARKFQKKMKILEGMQKDQNIKDL